MNYFEYIININIEMTLNCFEHFIYTLKFLCVDVP